MPDQNLIDYIIKKKKLSQSDLAKELGVSRAQITKWKSGERLPSERRSQLLKLAGLMDSVSEDWAIFAQSEDNAVAWCNYFLELIGNIEWGFSLRDLCRDCPELYLWHALESLMNMGAHIEPTAPQSHWINEEEGERTTLSACLFEYLDTWGQLHDWIDEVLEFDDVNDDAEYELFDVVGDLRWVASGLAIEDMEPSSLSAIGCESSKIRTHIEKCREDAAKRLTAVCTIRTKHGLPITADYFHLLTLPAIELAEVSWFAPKPESRHLGEAIKAFLPYAERELITFQEYHAMMLRQIDTKLDQVLAALNK